MFCGYYSFFVILTLKINKQVIKKYVIDIFIIEENKASSPLNEEWNRIEV